MESIVLFIDELSVDSYMGRGIRKLQENQFSMVARSWRGLENQGKLYAKLRRNPDIILSDWIFLYTANRVDHSHMSRDIFRCA